jgi:uncharacterized protein
MSAGSARHPYRLTSARTLAEAEAARHVADMVWLVLLTAPGERLHRPDFGAGLGASAVFQPLDQALLSLVEARARGSLERSLGDRVEVLDLAVSVVGESRLQASVTYRLRPAGEATAVEVVAEVGT